MRDVQNIADILVDPEGALENATLGKTSHALLVGAILHVLYAGEDKTLRGVANFLSATRPVRFELTPCTRMMTTPHLGDGDPIRSSPRRRAKCSTNRTTSVPACLSTAMSFLGLYRDPTVAEVTSRCDWRIADLIAPSIPIAVPVVPPSDISRTKPLIRLILNQIGRRLTESLDGSDGIGAAAAADARRVPGAGALDFFETALAFMAGLWHQRLPHRASRSTRSTRLWAEPFILDNCHVRVTFATNDERTAKRISETLGTATEMRAQRNSRPPARAVAGPPDGVAPETARPLLTRAKSCSFRLTKPW